MKDMSNKFRFEICKYSCFIFKNIYKLTKILQTLTEVNAHFIFHIKNVKNICPEQYIKKTSWHIFWAHDNNLKYTENTKSVSLL